MKFVVKTLNSARHEVDIESTETVGNLKKILQERTNIEISRQKLIFLGRVLQDDKVLSEYDLEGKVLHLVESLQPAGTSSSGENTARSGGVRGSGEAQPPPNNGPLPTPDHLTDQMVDSILNTLGIDASEANIQRQRLNDGGFALSFNVNDNYDEQVNVRIENSATTTATQQPSSAAPASGSNNSAPGGRLAGPHLDRIINHLRVVRDTMRHIQCTSDNGSNVINETLLAPCIRRQHYAGPTVEEGATPEEVQRRTTSRQSIETYSHILIDTADIMQEMVRYMNQYARLLHHDPPLNGGDLEHANNLVSRMAASFHEISHAFHLLSDYGITLNNQPPRRLWMAQLTGASVILQERPINRENLENLLNQTRQAAAGLAGSGVAAPAGSGVSAPAGSGVSTPAASSTTTTSITRNSSTITTVSQDMPPNMDALFQDLHNASNMSMPFVMDFQSGNRMPGVSTNRMPGVSNNRMPGVSTNRMAGVSINRTQGASLNRAPGVSINTSSGAPFNRTPGVSINSSGTSINIQSNGTSGVVRFQSGNTRNSRANTQSTSTTPNQGTTTTTTSSNTATTTTPDSNTSNSLYTISLDIPLPGSQGDVRNVEERMRQDLAQNMRSLPTGMPRSNLPCNSRHRAASLPMRCNYHNNRPANPSHSHSHSHSHGHTHSHSHHPGHAHAHGPRQAPLVTVAPSNNTSDPEALRALNEALGLDESQATPPSYTPAENIARLANMFGYQAEDISDFANLLQNMPNPNPNQRISEFWPHIRELMLRNGETFDNSSHLSSMLHIIASQFSFPEFISAVNNNDMFDVLYRPLRDFFTQNLFGASRPSWEEINDAVTTMINDNQNDIAVFFFVQQQEASQVDELRTIQAMVREFIRSIFRGLYHDRGDIAAGFGRVFGSAIRRLSGLILAYGLYVNSESRTPAISQIESFLERIIPFDTITRDELYDYVVPLSNTGDSDEEFVDAHEDAPDTDMKSKEETSEEDTKDTGSENVIADVSQPSPSSMDTDSSKPVSGFNGHARDSPTSRESGGVLGDIPSEWKRVIDEDTTKMESANYTALSNGYLSSLPAKRRKTDTKYSSNPDEVLTKLISQSATSDSSEMDDIVPDDEMRGLFKEKLTKDLKKKLEKNTDVEGDRFPSASKLKHG